MLLKMNLKIKIVPGTEVDFLIILSLVHETKPEFFILIIYFIIIKF